MIDAIDKPAIFINQDYIIEAVNTPYRNTYPVNIKPGFSKCFSVSHNNTRPCDQCGETCPMAQCKETGRSASTVHIHSTNQGQSYCDILMRPVHDNTGELLGYLEILDKLAFASNKPSEGKMIGESDAFKTMLNKINRAAKSDIAVLLQGETGTGKELVSQALHSSSHRADKPFVVIECTGLTDALFESELFGYEKGAFTGAVANKKGLVEAAQGGTLFFDEIGDVPLSMQVKLLRLLETQTYRPVGGVHIKQANFRLVCASHKDLKAMVATGAFRQDLYYRIAGFPIFLPPLRERQDDIILLCEHILSSFSDKKRLHKKAKQALMQYNFPGNVRELKNVIEQASLLADENVIFESDLPDSVFEKNGDKELKGIVPLEVIEANYLTDIVHDYSGSIDELAESLNVSKRTLYRKLQALGLKLP
ncbi:sigma-54 interaction domain-containing protein [Alteromonas sp. A079]|uniref:sigma-54 interaction domain-containing protein n=1 Tax=Alteromonas sp. A079 TaxID=3410268 RepID=UPI003BA27A62